MGSRLTRRDMLKLAGGSVLGLFFTPAPWKLVGDSAVWSQNWSAIAKLPRGEVTFRYTACTLCPVGCSTRARCVAGIPVGLSGVAADPLSRGALCPAGFSGHQLPWHSARVRVPSQRVGRAGHARLVETSLDDAVAVAARAITERKSGELVVILDDRPGRVRSQVYRAFARAVDGGVYVPNPSRLSRPLERLASCFEPATAGPLTLNAERARTILTFGAPLFDGYGGPGMAGALLRSRRSNGRPRILAVEPRSSRTTALADHSLSLRPGTEAILALGLAHVLLSDGLVDANALRRRAADFDTEDFRGLVARFTPEQVSRQTGVDPSAIVDLAHRLADGPSLVLGTDPSTGPLSSSEETAIWGLNLLLMSADGEGVLGVAESLPAASIDGDLEAPLAFVPAGAARAGSASGSLRELGDVPDHSVCLIVFDASGAGGALSHSALQEKLAPGGRLVSFSPWSLGLSRFADLIVPAPTGAEWFEEGSLAPLFGPAAYRVAAPLLETPAGMTDPSDFVRSLAAAAGSPIPGDAAGTLDLMKRRVEAIHARRRGRVVRLPQGDEQAVGEIETAEALWDALAAGGIWLDEAPSSPPERFRLLGNAPGDVARAMIAKLEAPITAELIATLSGWSASCGPAAAAPLLSKLGRESGLREASPDALMAPATIEALGLKADRPIQLETENGTITRIVRPSADVGPGVVHLASGPGGGGQEEGPLDSADLFRAGSSSAQRALSVRVQEV